MQFATAASAVNQEAGFLARSLLMLVQGSDLSKLPWVEWDVRHRFNPGFI